MLPKLHVESAGQGPPLLLVHGLAGSARNFRPQVRALRDRYRIIHYDARGHARSEAPPEAGGYGLDALVADAERVLDTQGIGEPVVAGGLSLGAATVLHWALAWPTRVRALVLASPPGGGGEVGSIGASAEAFAQAIEREGLEAAGERFVWGAERMDPAAASWVRQGFLEHPPHALAALLRGALRELPTAAALAPRVAALGCPMLLVAGTADAPSLAAAQTFAAAAPHAQLELLEGAGHVVNLERADEFNALLGEFLDRLPRGPGLSSWA